MLNLTLFMIIIIYNNVLSYYDNNVYTYHIYLIILIITQLFNYSDNNFFFF